MTKRIATLNKAIQTNPYQVEVLQFNWNLATPRHANRGGRNMATQCTSTSVALSVFALPKTGSTFLGLFLKCVPPVWVAVHACTCPGVCDVRCRQLSVEAQLCRVHETRWRCAATVNLGCPTRWGGHRRCHKHEGAAKRKKKPPRCFWSVQLSRTFRQPASCCDVLEPPATSDLLDEPLAANGRLKLMPAGARDGQGRVRGR